MTPHLKDSLLTAVEQCLSCDAHGTTRGVVADGYSCIDSCWSVVLILAGASPPRNHKHKLDQAFPYLQSALSRDGVSYSDVEALYRLWLDVRYSQKGGTPHDAFRYRLTAHRVLDATLDEVAETGGTTAEALEEQLYTELIGERFPVYQEAIAWLHEKRQEELERAGEMGFGSKLGNKLANTSNYCEFSLISDNAITREILAKEKCIDEEVLLIHDSFLKIIEKIDYERRKRGVSDDDIPNYSLGLRVRYTGASVTELGERWGKLLAKAFEQITQRLKDADKT